MFRQFHTQPTDRRYHLSPVALAFLMSCSAAVAGDTKTITSPDLNYTIAMPATCRLEEGPGTLEAICSPDLDAAKSQVAVAASALLLELDAERVPPDVKAPYGEKEFQQELPESVCGEEDATKVRLADIKRAGDDARVTWTATVTCPEIKFLGLSERTAAVRYIITPAFRYRLMTRTPSSTLAETQAARDAFMASFAITGAKAP
jgi:hypothetical protein